MSNYKITPLRLGTLIRPASNMNRDKSETELAPFPINAYYLEGDEHKIIVDTGGSVPKEGDWHQPYTREPEEEMDAALAKHGISVEDIDIVLFTHLHWDHAGNNHFFQKARFVAQKQELEAYLARDDKGYEDEEFTDTRYETVDGDVDIVPGIKALLVPGHSKGSQAFVVDTEEGQVILTGDLVPGFENWTSVPKVPSSTIEDYDAAMRSFAKLEALGIDKIYPGHEQGVYI